MPLLRARRTEKSIVFIKLAGLGDTALMSPMINMIRRTFPEYRVYAVVTPITRPLLKLCPDLDGLIHFDPLGLDKGFRGLLRILKILRQGRHHAFVDFEQHIQMIPFLAAVSGAPIRVGLLHPEHDRGRLYTHPVAYDDRVRMIRTFHSVYGALCEAMGRKTIPFQEAFGYSFPIGGEAQAKIAAWKAEHAAGKILVGMHPGCSPNNVNKRWPMENFRTLIGRLVETDRFHVVVTGGPDEIPLARELAGSFKPDQVSLGAGFGFDEFVALIAAMDCFIANDTGPVHIGPWVGTRTIGMMGPETPERYGCLHPDSISMYKALPCSPCIHVHRGVSPDCNHVVKGACVKQITVEEVHREVMRLTEMGDGSPIDRHGNPPSVAMGGVMP